MKSTAPVSEEVVRFMALNIKKSFDTDIAVAVSGLAGPAGETEKKKIGTVCFAFAFPDGMETVTRIFSGTREMVRSRSSFFAVDYCRRRLAASG